MPSKKAVTKKKVAKKKVVKKKQVAKKPEQKLANIHPLVGWVELNTTEPSKAKEFYSKLFGWKTIDEDMPGIGKYTMFGKAVNDYSGGIAPVQDASTPPHWLIYFTVKNVDSSTEAAEKLGAKIIAPPMDIPDGRISILMDPSGAMFALWASVK